ncbi:hypothetical protein Deba_3034 [Desulfarculus baarsii DSM 2075]|uniref:VWA domain-containing protein n=1 Tax=Desulfarculus baarsii (strain ATCC 33931 / DSM 2075 / LMG 7858 / VKM B-1802 / 2st14) TaxID=644282 RepID=E1QLF2_DESB2|nr:hypothetical protein [Desulfarculus baarsii]ADK86387.1 hypothetical protein Deba_3034 [Desulfarculus baarsii DSM 2075]
MPHRSLAAWLVLLALTLSAAACAPEPAECLPAALAAALAAGPKKATPQPGALKWIKVYYDVSTSMRGFLPKDRNKAEPGHNYPLVARYVGAEYAAQGAVKLLHRFGRGIEPFGQGQGQDDDQRRRRGYAKVMEIAGMAGEPYDVAYISANGAPADKFHDESRLELALEQAAKEGDDTLSIIFSDLFFCHGHSAKGMMDLSKAALDRALEGGKAVGLVAVPSRFAGAIYDLPGLDRFTYAHPAGKLPFYVLAIGRPRHVKAFLEAIERECLAGLSRQALPPLCPTPAPPPGPGRPAKPKDEDSHYRVIVFGVPGAAGPWTMAELYAQGALRPSLDFEPDDGLLLDEGLWPKHQEWRVRPESPLRLILPAGDDDHPRGPKAAELDFSQKCWAYQGWQTAGRCADRWRVTPAEVAPLAWRQDKASAEAKPLAGRQDDASAGVARLALGRPTGSGAYYPDVSLTYLLSTKVWAIALSWPDDGWIAQWDFAERRGERRPEEMEFLGTPDLRQFCGHLQRSCQRLARQKPLAQLDMCFRVME